MLGSGRHKSIYIMKAIDIIGPGGPFHSVASGLCQYASVVPTLTCIMVFSPDEKIDAGFYKLAFGRKQPAHSPVPSHMETVT